LNNHSVDTAFADCRSINVTGDYRAIFHENKETVTFMTIGTHSELYS
jgi:mRNA-degrading endonuclease YafQ of YafQ-DinJ toxin-antitoxin module